MNSQTQIDFRTVPINVPSLCIPRVYPNINEARIRKIFDELALGTIDHLDIISKTTDKGEKFNRVFIHFRRWYTDGNAGVARERLLNGKDIKIIYDDPWFWKISVYKAPVSNSGVSDCPPAYNCVYNYGNNESNYDNNKSYNINNDDKKEDDDDNWRKPRRK